MFDFTLINTRLHSHFKQNVQTRRRVNRGKASLRISMSHLRSIKYRADIEITRETQGPVIFLDETADPQDDEPGQEWLYAERGRPARGPVRAYLIIHRGVNVWIR